MKRLLKSFSFIAFSPRRHRVSNARGFSLVELVVVTALFAIVTVSTSSLLLSQLNLNSSTERKAQLQDQLTLQKLALADKDVCLKTFNTKIVSEVKDAGGKVVGYSISKEDSKDLQLYLGKNDPSPSMKVEEALPAVPGTKLVSLELKGVSTARDAGDGKLKTVGELLIEAQVEKGVGGSLVKRSIPMLYTFDPNNGNRITYCEASLSGNEGGGGGSNGGGSSGGGSSGSGIGSSAGSGGPPAPTIGPIADFFDNDKTTDAFFINPKTGKKISAAEYDKECVVNVKTVVPRTCAPYGGCSGGGEVDVPTDTCGVKYDTSTRGRLIPKFGTPLLKEKDFNLSAGTGGIPEDAKFVQLQVFAEGGSHTISLKSKDGTILSVPLRPGESTKEDQMTLCTAEAEGFIEEGKSTCIRTVEVPVGEYSIYREYRGGSRYPGSARVAVIGYRSGNTAERTASSPHP